MAYDDNRPSLEDFGINTFTDPVTGDFGLGDFATSPIENSNLPPVTTQTAPSDMSTILDFLTPDLGGGGFTLPLGTSNVRGRPAHENSVGVERIPQSEIDAAGGLKEAIKARSEVFMESGPRRWEDFKNDNIFSRDSGITGILRHGNVAGGSGDLWGYVPPDILRDIARLGNIDWSNPSSWPRDILDTVFGKDDDAGVVFNPDTSTVDVTTPDGTTASSTPTFVPIPDQTVGGGGGGGGSTSGGTYEGGVYSDATSASPAWEEVEDRNIIERQIYEAVINEVDPELKEALKREYEVLTGQPFPSEAPAPDTTTTQHPAEPATPDVFAGPAEPTTSATGGSWIPDWDVINPPQTTAPVIDPVPDPIPDPIPDPVTVPDPTTTPADPTDTGGTGGGTGTGDGSGTGDGTGDGDGDGGTTQELLNYLASTPQYRTVIEEPGDLVDINYLYDIGGDSIFAPNVEGVGNERPYVYAKSGGMIQQTNLEQLLKLLGV